MKIILVLLFYITTFAAELPQGTWTLDEPLIIKNTEKANKVVLSYEDGKVLLSSLEKFNLKISGHNVQYGHNTTSGEGYDPQRNQIVIYKVYYKFNQNHSIVSVEFKEGTPDFDNGLIILKKVDTPNN